MDPDSYRQAMSSEDEAIAARIGSVGRVVPGIEVEIRESDGGVAATGETGEIFVRGAQVSGEYVDVGGGGEGWFATRDLGYLDAGGYLFVLGRADDTIIRGGENIAPAMIEEVLLDAPGVAEAVVVGLPDEDWGQRLAAVVVSDGRALDVDQLRDWCRGRLRSSLTPEELAVWPELPVNDMGKVLRRDVMRRLASGEAHANRTAVGSTNGMEED